MIGFVLGRILLAEAALMLLPLLVTLLYGESTLPAFLLPMALLVLSGCAL